MTVTQTPAVRQITAVERSSTIDVVRAMSLFVVVVLHALMVGAWTDADGGLLTKVAMSGEPWFAPITWIVQIMPLFFISGGYVALLQWRRLQAQRATAGEYVARRVRRLVIPAVVMAAVVGAAFAVAHVAGADPALLAEAGLRIGQPLWFLAVYLGVTALVPAMAWLHDRRPVLAIAALTGGALLIDVTSQQTGMAFGYVNLALVWLLMQQLGFAMLDGMTDTWSKRRLYVGMGASIALLISFVGLGWSPDMIENLNPPTFALVLLGIAQFFGLQLARPWLDRVTSVPVIARTAAKVGATAMSAYLWHMPLIMLIVAGMWALGLPMPVPHSPVWWATRLTWLLVVCALVAPFAVFVARADVRATAWIDAAAARLRPLPARALVSVALAIGGTLFALLVGLDAWIPALASATMLGGAAVLSSPRYSTT